MMNAHLTAISRNALPVPVRWLLSNGLIHGKVLDYGCGKCKPLNDQILAKTPGITEMISYDPHFSPNPNIERGMVYEHHFDVVLCTYVLCVLSEKDEWPLLKRIQQLTAHNGVAYITVRADEPTGGYGKSSKGTFQRNVELPGLYLLRNVHQYRIYLMGPETIVPQRQFPKDVDGKI